MRARSKRLWDTWQEWRGRPAPVESNGGSTMRREKDPRSTAETRASVPPERFRSDATVTSEEAERPALPAQEDSTGTGDQSTGSGPCE